MVFDVSDVGNVGMSTENCILGDNAYGPDAGENVDWILRRTEWYFQTNQVFVMLTNTVYNPAISCL